MKLMFAMGFALVILLLPLFWYFSEVSEEMSTFLENPQQSPVTCSHTFSVKENEVIDACGKPHAFKGINWFGFETQDAVAHGLWERNYKKILKDIKAEGFNAIRLPFALDNVINDPQPDTITYEVNPSLQDLSSLEVMDRVIAEACRLNLSIILDHHRIQAHRGISELWYDDRYDEAAVIEGLRKIVSRYEKAPCVIGMDLKNEPHGKVTWGSKNPQTDWAMGANNLGKAVHKENPDLLLFVSGMEYQGDETTSPSIWGGYIGDPQSLDLPKNKTVLAPHAYGPTIAELSLYPGISSYEELPRIWDTHFGQYAEDFPIAITEYGLGKQHEDADAWFDAFLDYLDEKEIKHRFYWSVNPNGRDMQGYFNESWKPRENPPELR